ncbi:hypothetical protein B0T24DRAFT_395448 [Lasiosphaeria ovina]|uniref:Exonuclease domain-containing protein n=1 Tax=Lasiosphaeria ovina TaxID=92902 RepID=A0AAE0N0G0_9PEZI|nr:hypothetical protein B0T24DRAFT_395448 [Lasiosphaeria ovina]
MDAVLRNFKTIPCPSGVDCSKTNCQWQHAWDKKSASPPATTTTAPRPTESHNNGQDHDHDQDHDQGGPRKRRRLSSESQSANHRPHVPASAPLLTTKKAVSPPPLKRKEPQPAPSSHTFRNPFISGPSAGPTTTPITTPTRAVTTAARSSTLKVAIVQAATPRKAESLNPRHLKSTAPAAHDFRYKALKMLHEQFQRLNKELKKDASDSEAKFVLSDQEIIWMALDIEEKMATDKPSIYQNVIKNQIMSYRRMTVVQWKDERAAELKKKEDAKKPVTKSFLGPPKEVDTGLTPAQEVDFLSRLLTPVSSLAHMGYVTTVPTDEDIAKARAGEEASRGWEVCDRCTTRFRVFPGRREEDGALTSGGKCTHHWGKIYYPERTVGSFDKPAQRYRCCGQQVGESTGCTTGETHVFKAPSPSRLAALLPFAETPPNPLAPKDRAVCFDCEMCYTVHGLELVRLTATSWPDGKELLDVLVHPVGEILDLNSRFSGILAEDIVNAKPWSAEGFHEQEATANDGSGEGEREIEEGEVDDPQPKRKEMQIVSSPIVARDLLFSLVSPETPLIGHGLENDLNALRIVHPTIIDTILLYPHRRGLPLRNSLKVLMDTLLNKVIQKTEVDGKIVGHDSAEDARAAGELVRLKVQDKWQDMKRLGWTLVDGVFVPPGAKKDPANGRLTEKFLEDGQSRA